MTVFAEARAMNENEIEASRSETTDISAAALVPHDTELAARRHRLVRFVRSRVRDVEQAEDLVQDVMYQFLRSGDAGTAIEDATAWLFRAARNRIVDWYRRRKSEPIAHEAGEPMDGERIVGERIYGERLAEASLDPQRLAESSELWEAFLLALDELPEDQRDVFILHELEGISFREIAAMTGVNQNTLLSRKRYAVLALRRKLQPYR